MQNTNRATLDCQAESQKFFCVSQNSCIVNDMNTIEWIEEVRGTNTYNAVCERAGITPSTLTRQLTRGRIGHVEMVKIARSHNRNVLDALVVSGLINRQDIAQSMQALSLADATDEEIAGEVWRRLVDGEAGTAITDPITGPRGPSHLSVVPDNVAASKNDGTHNEFEGRD